MNDLSKIASPPAAYISLKKGLGFVKQHVSSIDSNLRLSNATALLGLISHAEMSKVPAGQRFSGFHCTP